MEKPTLREKIFAGSIVAILSAGSLAVAYSQRETSPTVDSTTTVEPVTTTTEQVTTRTTKAPWEYTREEVAEMCADELDQYPKGFAVAYLDADGDCAIAIP